MLYGIRGLLLIKMMTCRSGVPLIKAVLTPCLYWVHAEESLTWYKLFAPKKCVAYIFCSWQPCFLRLHCINTLRPRQNGRRFADDVFKCIFLNENVWVSLKISMKFVPKIPINNNPALVQIMAWRLSGGKPLSEPMMVSLLTQICVTRPGLGRVHKSWVRVRVRVLY